MHATSTSVYVHVCVLFNAVYMYSDPLSVFKLCRLRKYCLVLDGFLRKEVHGSVWLGRMDAGCYRHLSEHCIVSASSSANQCSYTCTCIYTVGVHRPSLKRVGVVFIFIPCHALPFLPLLLHSSPSFHPFLIFPLSTLSSPPHSCRRQTGVSRIQKIGRGRT